jgi:sporulation protein YlmC with PRC-barrel domain
MELTSTQGALTDLLGLPVRDASGRTLGRVVEVRARRAAGGELEVEALLVGGRALLRRLRGPETKAKEVAWGAVSEVRGEEILVIG